MGLDRAVPPDPYTFLPPVPSFTLTSSDITQGQPIGDDFTFEGSAPTAKNLSPQLSWSGFPSATAGFSVTCFDPDAPTPSGFWHWALANIPADVTTLATGGGAPGAAPTGSLSLRNDYGIDYYGGPQPPEGDRAHRYFFVVHAMDVAKLDIDATVSPAVLSFNLAFHTLARAVLVATYQR